MRPPKFVVPDLGALYSQPYDQRMRDWRELSSRYKANHIAEICKSNESQIVSVLEVGSGTGDVLRELARHWTTPQFTGIEIGTERSVERETVDGRVRLSGYDGVTIPFDDEEFDLVYATHVLEHVTHERPFLSELRRVSKKLVYVEVPCELHLRTSTSALQTSLDIGHINSYTPHSFVLTLETSGLAVDQFRVYDQAYAVHRFQSPALVALFKFAVRRSLFSLSQSLATRIFTYDVGALCTKSDTLNI
ncbi:MAG: class I SAM-dependent methyltransferase [Methyloceanibacter sp.]|nr:class I SAM-dependent methyltransferase [Methyloceanibacter sp.]